MLPHYSYINQLRLFGQGFNIFHAPWWRLTLSRSTLDVWMKLVNALNYSFTCILQATSLYKGKLDSEIWSSKKLVPKVDGTKPMFWTKSSISLMQVQTHPFHFLDITSRVFCCVRNETFLQGKVKYLDFQQPREQEMYL